MLVTGDIIKIFKNKDGKFFHDFTNLSDASQFELLQLEKVALDLRNRLQISLEMKKFQEGDKTKEV